MQKTNQDFFRHGHCCFKSVNALGVTARRVKHLYEMFQGPYCLSQEDFFSFRLNSYRRVLTFNTLDFLLWKTLNKLFITKMASYNVIKSAAAAAAVDQTDMKFSYGWYCERFNVFRRLAVSTVDDRLREFAFGVQLLQKWNERKSWTFRSCANRKFVFDFVIAADVR